MKTLRTQAIDRSINGLTKQGVAKLSIGLVGGLLGGLSMLTAPSALAQQTPIIAVTPDPQGSISVHRQRAHKLFQAITAVRVPIDDPRLLQMETLLAAGDQRGAVAIATKDPLFLDVQIRDLAKKMSTREESVRAPMSDFVATFIGVVRDSDTTSAKELLTGNFYYRVDPTIATANTIAQVEMDDIVTSNRHYEGTRNNMGSLASTGLSPAAVLVKQSPQLAMAGNEVVDQTDAAGLITTRSFMEAHAVAGTNRRMVEYSMREFMCVGMSDWADSNNADERVGQDVTRKPSGDTKLYDTTCKSCHSGMDGFRGAFAFTDFTNNAQQIRTTVPGKMTRNATEAPEGWRTVNDSIENFATGTKNMDQFGWRSSSTGNGKAGFGKMLADSRGFSRCMVRRAFKAVCRRPPLINEESLVRTLADQFETDGYHMRRMFENVAVQQQCVQ